MPVTEATKCANPSIDSLRDTFGTPKVPSVDASPGFWECLVSLGPVHTTALLLRSKDAMSGAEAVPFGRCQRTPRLVRAERSALGHARAK